MYSPFIWTPKNVFNWDYHHYRVFFLEKILPIIVLKHNLQLSHAKFATICTYDKINEVTPTINR